MSVESDIREAATPGKERLWHHKGYYSIIVVSVEERGGVEWVTYFQEQNCDLSLASYADAFIRANVHKENLTSLDLVKEQQFEANVMRVMSMERAVTKFRKRKPVKVTEQTVLEVGGIEQ